MNKIEINIVEIRKTFKKKINASGWGKILDPIIDSLEFETAVYKLKKYVEADQRFTPKLKDIFNAFVHCPYEELKVIILGQDPYPQLFVADGISFSCSNTMKEQPSLKYIFNELETKYENYERNPDLKRWSEQGVLMLNTALTVEINKIGSHYNLWKPITQMILSAINKDKSNIAVGLLGKKAQEWQLYTNNQYILKAPHPASAAYKNGKWNSCDIFELINDHLIKNEIEQIIW
jgi:uracil-DNA glycosylase